MTVFEKAAELGAMIRDSAEKKRLDEAAAAYNADDELISMIEKYNEHYAKVKADEESGSLREGVGEMVNQQLSAMYDVIMARPTMKAYTDANAADRGKDGAYCQHVYGRNPLCSGVSVLSVAYRDEEIPSGDSAGMDDGIPV